MRNSFNSLPRPTARVSGVLAVGALSLSILTGCGGDNTFVGKIHCKPGLKPALGDAYAHPTPYSYKTHDDKVVTAASHAVGLRVWCENTAGVRSKIIGLEEYSDKAIDEPGLLVVRSTNDGKEDDAQITEVIQDTTPATLVFPMADSFTAKINDSLYTATFANPFKR